MFKDVTDPIASAGSPIAERHGAARDPSAPPPGAATDWTVPQCWDDLEAEDHAVWDLLFARQQSALAGRAVRAFEEGLEVLRLSRPGVPEFDELNERLFGRTGWTVVAVPGLVPDDVFFEHLRHRRFPAGNFIRKRSQLDYLEEPDVFHDVFGHVPLLANPAIADFVQALGALGLQAMQSNALHRLTRLYWYTVEFGLIDTPQGIRTYGAGILSSGGEIGYCIESPNPNRIGFDLLRIMQTRYKIDTYQETYFVIRDFGQLFDATAPDFTPYYDELRGREPHAPSAVLANDKVYHRGILPMRAA